MKNENIIIVVFINTPYAFSYNLLDSEWKIEENQQQYQLIAGFKIYASNIYNIEDIQNLKFGVFYREQYNYKFSLYQFTNFQFGEIHYITIEDKDFILYSKIITSFGTKPQQIYIFTYEPKELNKYNFLRFDLGTQQCIIKEGYLYLTLFKKAEIYNAYFIENSPVLFYNIRKRELNGEYSFYIGAVNIESLVLLYNIKISDYKNIYFNYGFLYSNKAFLKYFEGNNLVEICPFISDASKQMCQFFININNYYIFDNSSGLNENQYSDSCQLKIDKYCVDQCPIGFQIENDECRECNTNYLYYYATKKCIDQPNNDYPQKGKIIYNCKEKGLKYYDENCYQSCSEIYGINSLDNENNCITCESQNQIFFEEKCYDSCSKIYGVIDLDNINQCYQCKSKNKIYFEESCYDNCSQIFGIIDPNDKNQCISCQEQNKIYFEENCYQNCSLIYGIVNPDNKKECITCKNEQKIYYNSECYDNCSLIYGIINPENENECMICRN